MLGVGVAHRILLLLSVGFGLSAHPSLFRDSDLVRAAAVLILTDSAVAVWRWWRTKKRDVRGQRHLVPG
jgi:hypothetical protein